MDRKREAGVHECADGAQHALLVVAERLRSTRDEDDPATVPVDVALEERHAMLVRRSLDGTDEYVQCVRGGFRPFGGDDLVGSGELHEGDRGVAVLAFERANLEELGAERSRDGDLDGHTLHRGQRLDRSADVRCGPE